MWRYPRFYPHDKGKVDSQARLVGGPVDERELMQFALWSFASPWMLLWGIAAALPVLIHLWSRRRYEVTPWPTMQFLLAALRKHRRRLQIEQWLLLALRTLILLLLAAALAEPILSGALWGGGVGGAPPLHTVLVIDASYSMSYRQAGTSRFAVAQERSAELVRNAKLGDAFSLVILADPPEAIIAAPAVNHVAVLREIKNLPITHGAADLLATWPLVERLLGQGASRYAQQTVHVFSDLGLNTWASIESAESRAQLIRLEQQAKLTLTDVGQADAVNVALTALTALDDELTVGKPIKIEVELRSLEGREPSRQRVELFVNEQSLGEQVVSLAAGGRANVVFAHTFQVAGEHSVRAQLGEDKLDIDNRRWLSVPVQSGQRVLCVQGQLHAAEYIALALQPRPGASAMFPEVVSEFALLERDLSDYAVVFLCNVANVGADEARVLRDYVVRGGGLVIVLGDLVQAANYNERLGESSEFHVLPGHIGEVIGGEQHTFDPREYQHPLVAPFRGFERAGLLTVPTWRYFQLTQVAAAASVALAFGNGDPAIVDGTVGQGRVFVLATAASPSSLDRTTDPPTPWTALASWPSFPPLVHELVRLAASGQMSRRNLLVGEMLESRIPESFARDGGRLTTAAGESISLTGSGRDRLWTFEHTEQPGLYRATYGPDQQMPELFAVNVHTAESDVKRIDVEQLADFFRPQPSSSQPQAASIQVDSPLFRLFLLGVVALLIVETFLAWRFGRGML